IGRVICCLVARAIKRSKRGDAVEIWAAAGGDETEVLIGVTDEGPGLCQETTARLLDRFQQSSLSSCDAGDQRLALAGALVRLNLGEILVESEQGHGTTIWFSLPVAAAMTIIHCHLDMLNRQGVAGIDASLIEVLTETGTGNLNLTPVIDEFLQQELT